MQIKTRTTLTRRLSALALVAILSVSACAELAAQTWWASPVGITLGQTARLTFANVGEPRGIVVDWRFIDADGVTVARSERPLTIPFGKMVSVDLDRDTLPRPEARVQIRAEVDVLTPGNTSKILRTSLEVFNNDTGESTVFVIAII
jgi:hypothetical protein